MCQQVSSLGRENSDSYTDAQVCVTMQGFKNTGGSQTDRAVETRTISEHYVIRFEFIYNINTKVTTELAQICLLTYVFYI